MITIATLYLSLARPCPAIRQPAAILRKDEYEHPEPEHDRKLKGWM